METFLSRKRTIIIVLLLIIPIYEDEKLFATLNGRGDRDFYSIEITDLKEKLFLYFYLINSGDNRGIIVQIYNRRIYFAQNKSL